MWHSGESKTLGRGKERCEIAEEKMSLKEVEHTKQFLNGNSKEKLAKDFNKGYPDGE